MILPSPYNLDTDVLVIGAGGAGLRAAIEAHTAGVDVLVVSKGDFPAGCSTARAMGVMLAPFDAADSADRHFDDTVRGGFYLNNPRLVRLLVEEAEKRVEDIDRFGTDFDRIDGRYSLFPLTGSSVARGVIAGDRYRGGFFRGLVTEAERRGIRILDHVMIIDLLLHQGAVIGAVGLGLASETLIIIRAGAVIVATGGAGNLYSLTTNPAGITGDGYLLACRAGARLSDMEFVQGRVAMIHPPGMRGAPPPADGCVTMGGRFYNGLCERYMKKYHPEDMEQVTRAETARCAQREIMAGRASPHGGVFGDLSGVAPEELARFRSFLDACGAEDLDPSWQPYEWAPGAHSFMGGIVIDEHCRTDIAGLYAAGECVSGVMGANRLTGNALTETQVFGTIAGRSAAQWSVTAPPLPLSPDHGAAQKERLAGIVKRHGGIDHREVRHELRHVMSLYGGVVRDGEGLERALALLNDMEREKNGRLCLGNDRSYEALGQLIEVENLITLGRLVLSAALMRTETRGTHTRDDFPTLDEAWTRNIVISLQTGRMTLETKAVEGT